MVKCALEEENSFHDEQRKEKNTYAYLYIHNMHTCIHIQGISKVLLKTLWEHCPLPKQGQMSI